MHVDVAFYFEDYECIKHYCLDVDASKSRHEGVVLVISEALKIHIGDGFPCLQWWRRRPTMRHSDAIGGMVESSRLM